MTESVLFWNIVKIAGLVIGTFLALVVMLWLHGDPPDRR